MKVLLMLDYAQDYREPFLRELSKYVELTVGAQPCGQDGLSPPDNRVGYEYFDLESRRFMGFYWQPGLDRIFQYKNWDVVCCDFNLRHLARLFYFFKKRSRQGNIWIWRGLIFGRNSNSVLSMLRKFFLSRSAACLVYSDEVAEKVKQDFDVHAVSFNNTEVKREEFRTGNFDQHDGLRLLFVGTFKPRKRIDRLVNLVQRHSDISSRIIGPNMEHLDIPAELKNSDRLTIIGRTTGEALNSHFDWADLVVSPGNVGLLVMNAARHGKGIVVDNNSYHGPEHWLAKRAGQPFISFGCPDKVDRFMNNVMENRELLQKWGKELQALAKEKYTIEYMAEAHYTVFKEIVSRTSSRNVD